MKIKGRVLSGLGNTQPEWPRATWYSLVDDCQVWKVIQFEAEDARPDRAGCPCFDSCLPRQTWLTLGDRIWGPGGQDTRCHSLSSLSRPHLQTMDSWNTWSQCVEKSASVHTVYFAGGTIWMREVDDVSSCVSASVWYQGSQARDWAQVNHKHAPSQASGPGGQLPPGTILYVKYPIKGAICLTFFARSSR